MRGKYVKQDLLINAYTHFPGFLWNEVDDMFFHATKLPNGISHSFHWSKLIRISHSIEWFNLDWNSVWYDFFLEFPIGQNGVLNAHKISLFQTKLCRKPIQNVLITRIFWIHLWIQCYFVLIHENTEVHSVPSVFMHRYNVFFLSKKCSFNMRWNLWYEYFVDSFHLIYFHGHRDFLSIIWFFFYSMFTFLSPITLYWNMIPFRCYSM